MFCQYCGREIDAESRFCPHCGKNLQPAAKTAPAAEPSYYAAEFTRIRAGEKNRFNWAALFFGPYHQLYHGSTALFRKSFLPCLLAAVVWSFVRYAILSFAPAAAVFTDWGNAALNVWWIIVTLRIAGTYNRKLYEQVHGDASAISAKAGKVILLAAVTVICLLFVPVSPDSSAVQADIEMPGPPIETLLQTTVPEPSFATDNQPFSSSSAETGFTEKNIDLTLQETWLVRYLNSEGQFQEYSVAFVLNSYFSGGQWTVLQEQEYDSWEAAGTDGRTESFYQYTGYHNGEMAALTFAVRANRGQPDSYRIVSVSFGPAKPGRTLREITESEQRSFLYGLVRAAAEQDAAYTATKEDLLGNWVVDYSGEIFEITPYELGGTEYQITRIEGNTIHFVTPDGWYTSGTATLSEGGSKIHVYLSHFNGNTSWNGRRERTERLPIVNG